MTNRQTDVEDLTDLGVKEILYGLAPKSFLYIPPLDERKCLGEIVSLLDRTGADWPHLILGLEPTP